MARAAALAALLLLLPAACTQIRQEYGAPVEPASLDLEPGRTRYGELLAKLGPPSKLNDVPDGLLLLYEYLEVDQKQLGISIPYTNIFTLAVGRARGERRNFLALFDREGLLRGYAVTDESLDLGGGSELEVLIAVEPVVDTTALVADANPNRWGMFLLKRLPESLNRGTAPEVTPYGLEMRGAPSQAGQRTLEMR